MGLVMISVFLRRVLSDAWPTSSSTRELKCRGVVLAINVGGVYNSAWWRYLASVWSSRRSSRPFSWILRAVKFYCRSKCPGNSHHRRHEYLLQNSKFFNSSRSFLISLSATRASSTPPAVNSWVSVCTRCFSILRLHVTQETRMVLTCLQRISGLM